MEGPSCVYDQGSLAYPALMSAVEKVTVQVVVACLGLERGDGPVTIGKTPQVAGAIANGYLQDLTPREDPEGQDATETTPDPDAPAALTGSGEPRARAAKPRG